ncbi:MAG: helix-turn-helix transcriptional regulator [Pseudobdellovibrionaceae bacterium]|jgi:predicted transcriptional regulator
MSTGFKSEHLKELRQRLGYSAADVARRVQVPLETVKAWELCSAIPSVEYIAKLEVLFQQAQLCSQDMQTLSVTEMEMQQRSLDQIQT